MTTQKEASEVLVKATAQGFSIAIHGIQQTDGSWTCAVEKNEITFTDIPANEEAVSLGELRDYYKTEFELSFENAFKKFDESEWFLCHPGSLHKAFAEYVITALEKRFAEYDKQFPADSPMEKFIREKKREEWKKKA